MYCLCCVFVLAISVTVTAHTTTTFASDGWAVSVEVTAEDVTVDDFTGHGINTLDDGLLLHVSMTRIVSDSTELYPCRLAELKLYLDTVTMAPDSDTATRNVSLFRGLYDYLQ
jgi:hypothetical protein